VAVPDRIGGESSRPYPVPDRSATGVSRLLRGYRQRKLV